MNPKFTSIVPLLALLITIAGAVHGFSQNVAPAPPSNVSDVPDATGELTLEDDGKAVHVRVGDDLFCQFQYREPIKPILYPVYLKDGISMTRNYPMKKVAGEANDHPHHMSIWMGHEISGVDFWTNKSGKIDFQEIKDVDDEKDQFTVVNLWQRQSDHTAMLKEETTYRFGADKTSRWMVVKLVFTAQEDVVFEDTKEGLFAIRTHPSLRLSPDARRGVKEVTGKAANDSGVTGKAVWGKPAKWVDYHGQINGQPVGMTLYDHPTNFRHPTTWHAREYGLIAANPFGLHYFAGGPKGEGELTLKKNEKLQLIYGIRFYEGEFDANLAEQIFQHFSNLKW